MSQWQAATRCSASSGEAASPAACAIFAAGICWKTRAKVSRAARILFQGLGPPPIMLTVVFSVAFLFHYHPSLQPKKRVRRVPLSFPERDSSFRHMYSALIKRGRVPQNKRHIRLECPVQDKCRQYRPSSAKNWTISVEVSLSIPVAGGRKSTLNSQ